MPVLRWVFKSVSDAAGSAIGTSIFFTLIVPVLVAVLGILAGNPIILQIALAIGVCIGIGIGVGFRLGLTQQTERDKTKSESIIVRSNLTVVWAFYGVQTKWFSVKDVINVAIANKDAKLDVNNNLLSSKELTRQIPKHHYLILAYTCNEKIVAVNAEQDQKLLITANSITVQ